MTSDIAHLPTRRDLKARRSQAMHAQRLATAATPQARLLAVVGRARAVLAAADADDAALISEEAVEALTRILDDAEARAAAKVRKSHVRAA